MQFTFNKIGELRNLPAETKIQLVKDDGVYLLAKHDGKNVVSYAHGHGEGTFIGGDDFFQDIGTVGSLKLIDTKKLVFKIGRLHIQLLRYPLN